MLFYGNEVVWLTEWLLLEWARPVRTVICNQDLQEVVKPGENPQSALSCSCFWNRLNKLQHANLHLYLRKDTRHVVYKANTLTYHEVAARAQWITHKHTIKDTKHLMRLSGLYLWFSTSDFWKFRCVARWFWFILRGELLRNPIWFSAVRTKAIDYGENKDRLAVREFNSFGGAEHRRLLGLLLKTEKRKTWYFLGRTLYMHHIGVMNCLYYFVLLDTSVWIQIIWMLMGIIKPVLSYIFQQFQNLGWYFDEKNDI